MLRKLSVVGAKAALLFGFGRPNTKGLSYPGEVRCVIFVRNLFVGVCENLD